MHNPSIQRTSGFVSRDSEPGLEERPPSYPQSVPANESFRCVGVGFRAPEHVASYALKGMEQLPQAPISTPSHLSVGPP